MTRWTAFTGIVGVVLSLLLVLTRLSADAVRDRPSESPVTEPALPSAARRPVARSGRGVVAERPPARPPAGRETGPLDRMRAVDPEPTDRLADAADTDTDYELRLRTRAAALRGRSGVADGRSGVSGGRSGVAGGRSGDADAPVGSETPDDRTTEAVGGVNRAEAVGGVTPAESGGGVKPAEADLLSTRAMLANVAVSQGLFGAIVVAAAWWAGVPAYALGLDPLGGLPAVVVGLWVGVALWGAGEVGGRVAERVGVDPATGLRRLLAPTTRGEWVALLGVVLPVVAVFEELLFRGVVIGALATGFGLPAWWLVVPAAVVFAAGHSAQGRLGVVVTGVLGAVLGAVFVVTDSLLVVIVAHYVVNAAEFIVHES